jgi:uncharacterized protein YkwD
MRSHRPFRIRPAALLLLGIFFSLPSLAPPAQGQTAYQKQLLRLHNRERAKRNIRPLRLHPALNRAAVKYARVMNANDHFDHTGPAPDFSTMPDRIKAECSSCFSTMGENIALGQRNPAEVTRGWMNSPGHRRNILNRRFTRVGFGRAGSPIYWCTNFGG